MDEVLSRIKVIFAGFIDYPHLAMLFGFGIGEELIDFSGFQRSGVSIITDTNNKLVKGVVVLAHFLSLEIA